MSFELLDKFDAFAVARKMLEVGAEQHEQWAGFPMPLKDHALVIEPKFPMPQQIIEILGGSVREKKEDSEKPRSVLWSSHYRKDVVIFDLPDGKVTFGVDPGRNHLDLQLDTLGASYAWGIEQEYNAMLLLGTLVPHHTFKMYMLTGCFLESSKRSNVMYCFRRLRPTIAIGKSMDGQRLHVMCTLCMHPIAYYAGSHAGAMCPTDDVIAHLMLMRGDEAMFWKRSNQHPAHRPESALT